MADKFTGMIIADKYRLDSLLRRSSMGEIYRGVNVAIEKPVIVKVLDADLGRDEEIRRQFSAEARNAVHLSHPNILAVNDFGTDAAGNVYIVFDNFDGQTLQEISNAQGQLSSGRVVSLTDQIASALTELEAKGIGHSDLTPENILVGRQPDTTETVRIFDLSGELDTRDIYTVSYLAPETFGPKQMSDNRSDVYTLGSIVYQMLAGDVPFKGETATDVMLKQAEEPPAAINAFRKDVSPLMEQAVLKALNKLPEKRQQTPAELALELKLAAAPPPNNLWKTAFLVVGGIVVLASALIYATRVKQTDPVTVLQPDANGVPVQPINPATGAEEQTLAAASAANPGALADAANMTQPPGTLPGGDGYNAWGNGVAPPTGAPPTGYVPPGGQVYTIDPNTGSPFMPNDSGVVLVPVPVNTPAPKASPTPKNPAAANSNTSTAPPKPAASPRPEPAPARTPATRSPSRPEQPSDRPGNSPDEH